MAIIECPECAKPISDRARSCPDCGFPLNETVQVTQPAPKEADSSSHRTRHDAEDHLYYGDGSGVQVTSTRAVLHNTTYPIANISSVSVWKYSPKSQLWISILIAGIVVFVLGVNFASDPQAGQPLMGIGLAVIALASVMLAGAAPSFAVRLTAAGGEINALSSKDEAYISTIVDAVNKAIIARG